MRRRGPRIRPPGMGVAEGHQRAAQPAFRGPAASQPAEQHRHCNRMRCLRQVRDLHSSGSQHCGLQRHRRAQHHAVSDPDGRGTAISDVLLDYYTSAQVDAEIAANSFNGSDYYTKTQSDSRYFVSNANAGNISLIRNAVISTLTDSNSQIAFEHQRHPSGTALELTCDAYTRSEADSRHIQSGNLTSRLSLFSSH